MDQSVQPTQTDQPMHRAQPPVTIQTNSVAQPSKIPTQTTISVGKESAPAVIAQETGSEEQAVSVETANIEPKIDASVEHMVEKSPDREKPELSEAVQQAGVTHSGPGIIPDKIIVQEIPDNKFGITALAVPYEQAALEEKKAPFKSSKHWLMGIYEYVWRKINPDLGRKK